MQTLLIFIIILIFIILHTEIKIRSLTLHKFVHNRYIFLIPQWGLGNRLRSLSGAFSVAKKLNAELIVIWNKSDHFPQHINEIFTNIKCTPELPTNMEIYEIQHQGACELYSDVVHIDKNLPCKIESCMVNIKETEDLRFEFYEYAQPTYFIKQEIRKYCKQFMDEDTIGIHLRQGDIADARDNHFFGKWTDSKIEITKSSDLPCCSDADEEDIGCPPNIQTIDTRLRDLNFTSKNKFWIATDRIQCIPMFKQKLSPCQIRYLGCFEHIPDLETRDMRLALIDMYMLALCESFHGTSISSFSNEISVLKKGLLKQRKLFIQD